MNTSQIQDFIPSILILSKLEFNSGKMVLWDISPPSSWPANFLNEVLISCPNDLSLDLLACCAVSSMSLDLVRELPVFLGEGNPWKCFPPVGSKSECACGHLIGSWSWGIVF